MAMNKKEAKAFAEMKEQAEMARALSWPNFPAPKPLPIAEFDQLQIGWAYNKYSKQVHKKWCQHGCTYDSEKLEMGSRSKPPLYASEQEAWLAMYRELCLEYARELARILRNANPEPENQNQE